MGWDGIAKEEEMLGEKSFFCFWFFSGIKGIRHPLRPLILGPKKKKKKKNSSTSTQ